MRCKPQCEDFALRNFLGLLASFRRVILQDGALQYALTPHAKHFQYGVFATDTFRTFSQTANATIRRAEEEANLQLQHLPKTMAATLRGSTSNVLMEQERHRIEMSACMNEIQLHLEQKLDFIFSELQSLKKRKRGMRSNSYGPSAS